MSDKVKPTGLTPEAEAHFRANTTSGDPFDVHSASSAAWANVWFMLDESRARVAELEAKLADERKVLDVFNVVYEIELASGDDDAEFLRRGGFDARAVARGEFNEWRVRRAKDAAND